MSAEAAPPGAHAHALVARALVAIDLGAESCRVSLLRWRQGEPQIELVHRFPNAARECDGKLCWDLSAILAGLEEGLRRCAAIAHEGIRSIAVDGWAVDYVRLDAAGEPLGDPFCYRDPRTLAAEESLHRAIAPASLHALTGVRALRINTLYQLHADARNQESATGPWLNLPEYILHWLGGEPVAEATNASHTQLVSASEGGWCDEIFGAAGLDRSHAPRLVACGTRLGTLRGPLAELPGMDDVTLIAPACHDTASAIAGIPAGGEDWAYISSGTWSLVGTVVPAPICTPSAAQAGFTSLAGAGGATLFHVNVNGMWLLRQAMEQWSASRPERVWTVEELVAAAEREPAPAALFAVDAPDLMLPGAMLERINAQLAASGKPPLDESAEAAPAFANLIFHSLAARYAEVLQELERHSGKRLRRLFIVGGGSRNAYLNRLTAEASGLQVQVGAAESSTLGNFAVQLATLEQAEAGPSAQAIAGWAERLQAAMGSGQG